MMHRYVSVIALALSLAGCGEKEGDAQPGMSLEDAEGDEIGDVHHLLDRKVGGVHRREVVVEA